MKSTRILSIDMMRGATIALMILVNTPGSWSSVYSPLLHAKWHGCTLTDLVFPFFIFIMGVSMSISLFKASEKLAGESKGGLYKKIIKRGLIIFGLGLFLNLYPKFDLIHVRIPGVLQRIALVYVAASFIYLHFSVRGQLIISAFLLIGYWLAMTLIPVPGVGYANLEPGTNFAAWVDSILLKGHMWTQTKTWDPEGVLSTLPAIVSGLVGAIVGKYLFVNKQNTNEDLVQLFIIAGLVILSGLAWSLIFPINKALWTSSYVLYSSGLAIYVLLTSYYLIDRQEGYRNYFFPLQVFGKNAIAAYFLSSFFVKNALWIKVTDNQSLYSWTYEYIFASWLGPYEASFFFALSFVTFIYGIVWLLYRNQIFIKV